MKSTITWGLALSTLIATSLAQDVIDNFRDRLNDELTRVYSIVYLTDSILRPAGTQQAYAGTLYKWVDENGVVHYSDSPTDSAQLEENDATVFTVPEASPPDTILILPEHQKGVSKPEKSKTRSQAAGSGVFRKIAQLSLYERKQLIDKVCAYIMAEHGGSGDKKSRKRELERLAQKSRLNFDIAKPYRTRIPEQFGKVGIIFARFKTSIAPDGPVNYLFGKIIKQYKIDGEIPVTIYSSKGFVTSAQPTGVCVSGRLIFIDEYKFRQTATDFYYYLNKGKVKGAGLLILRDYRRYNKKNQNLSRAELIEAYTQDSMKVTIAHERAHIYDLNKDPVDKEVVACLAALRDVPSFYALHSALNYGNAKVRQDIRGLYKKYGYDNALSSYPIEEISNAAGKMLKREYHFYK